MSNINNFEYNPLDAEFLSSKINEEFAKNGLAFPLFLLFKR